MEAEMYHYTESGLQNVWLANGYKAKKTAHGKAVAIVEADGLHKAIGRAIACKGYMTGAELRFLRKELDLSQTRFGTFVGASEESVSLWERRGRVPKSASRLMQALYIETIDGNVKLKELIERLAALDRTQQDRMVFEDTGQGWREAA
jgi:DNA-binding transcriptional regulator YiaG